MIWLWSKISWRREVSFENDCGREWMALLLSQRHSKWMRFSISEKMRKKKLLIFSWVHVQSIRWIICIKKNHESIPGGISEILLFSILNIVKFKHKLAANGNRRKEFDPKKSDRKFTKNCLEITLIVKFRTYFSEMRRGNLKRKREICESIIGKPNCF